MKLIVFLTCMLIAEIISIVLAFSAPALLVITLPTLCVGGTMIFATLLYVIYDLQDLKKLEARIKRNESRG